jgi:hypothetical protein
MSKLYDQGTTLSVFPCPSNFNPSLIVHLYKQYPFLRSTFHTVVPETEIEGDVVETLCAIRLQDQP